VYRQTLHVLLSTLSYIFNLFCLSGSVHENAHGLNDGSWTPADGPLHDGPAQELFLKLQQLHDDYCVHVDITLPDSVQESFNDFFFARNKFSLGGPQAPVDEDANVIAITVTPTPSSGKKYTQNGVLQPVLSMVRGHTYVFDTSEASNAGHPLSVRIAEHVPVEGVRRVGTPGSRGSTTTFTVPMDAPDELTYYCLYHADMGTTITVSDDAAPAPARRLHEEGPISYDMACTQTYPNDPRMALQMSLYCLLGHVDQSLDKSIVQRGYGLSPACDTILKQNMRNQLTAEISPPPHMFCDSNVEENTCTVHPDIRTDGVNSCAKYCSQFENLECKAASVNSWSDQCSALRPWSCEEPAMDTNLMCQCGAVTIPFVTEKHVTTSCAKQTLPSEYPPNKFCDQDFAADTCTTVAKLSSLESGTCTEYCQKHELECVAAHDDWNCVGFREHSCDDAASSYMICTCGAPAVDTGIADTTTTNCDAFCSLSGKVCLSASATPETSCMLASGLPCQEPEDFATQLEYVCGADIERPEVVEEMASASCEHMMFYRDPVSRPTSYCPPRTLSLDAAVQDSCTVLAYTPSISSDKAGRTCDAYCGSFAGMKCVGAAEEVNNDCDVKQTLACDEAYSGWTSDLLCACAIDDTTMPAVVAASDPVISTACENMMLSPSRDTAKVDRVCESFPTENTCTVLATVKQLPARTCDEFCSSFHEMQCVAASSDKSGTCEEDAAMTCDAPTTSNDLLCTCGFKAGSARASIFDMAPVFEKNAVRSCPAYETATNNKGETYYTNEAARDYTMVELTLDVDVSGTGAASVTDINVRPDQSNSDRDTYNTAHVEACDGFESQIREGDPEEKCSFGHRLDKTQNCYGKVHGQTYSEASAACAERGGHIVRINDEDEYDLLKEIFGDQTFSVGLRDVGGRDWEWDGYPGGSADPYSNTYAPLATSEKEDCAQLNLKTGKLTGKYCFERETYLCEGIRDPVTQLGGDLMADEGGFCLWYLDDPALELPNDEDNGFTNSELAHFLLFDEKKKTKKYVELYDVLYPANNIPGHLENEANWDDFTYRKLGLPSDEPLVEKFNHNKSYHCHYSPTNFGVARIYIQQHMLERIYPGSMHKHCFCGYKHIGHFVDRCDCTRSGDRNGQCQKHHREQLWTETYHQTGEYVYCNNNNCEGQSP
jgi:hypothetical protein